MATEDKKISQLAERLYSNLLGTWEFILADSDNLTNYRISVAEMKKFILGVISGGVARPIGTNVAGALLTTDGAQDVSNKNLEHVSINGAYLDDDVTGTQLSLLKDLDVNVKTVLDGFNTRIGIVESGGSSQENILAIRYCYDDSFTTTQLDVNKSYSVDDILAKCGVAGYKVPYGKCQIQIWQRAVFNAREFSLVPPVTGKTIITTDADGLNIVSIKLESLSAQTTYNVSISFNISLH
jgi:hypothetical protein